MHKLSLRLSPGLPILDDLDTVKQSWQRILDAGARTIYLSRVPCILDVLEHLCYTANRRRSTPLRLGARARH